MMRKGSSPVAEGQCFLSYPTMLFLKTRVASTTVIFRMRWPQNLVRDFNIIFSGFNSHTSLWNDGTESWERSFHRCLILISVLIFIISWHLHTLYLIFSCSFIRWKLRLLIFRLFFSNIHLMPYKFSSMNSSGCITQIVISCFFHLFNF